MFRFDEFGFKVEEESPEQVSNKLLSTPFIEDPQQRLFIIKTNLDKWKEL